MKVSLTHRQRRTIAALEHGDITLHPTDSGRFAGAVVVEREFDGSLVLIARDGQVHSAELHYDDEDREVGPLFISAKLHRAEAHNQELVLSRTEFGLLWALAGAPQKMWPKDQLLRDVWGYDPVGAKQASTRTVDAHCCRLRRKLEQAGVNGWVINTRGLGYRLLP